VHAVGACCDGYVQPVVHQNPCPVRARGINGLTSESGERPCAQVFFADLNEPTAGGGGQAYGFDLGPPRLIRGQFRLAAES